MKNANQSTETFPMRVRRTLEDLAEIRESLVAAPATMGRKKEADLLLDLELASELKGVVDALRQLLWAYIQALSAKSGRHPREILDWYKMEIAVEMLRAIRGRTAPVSDMDIPPGFEQLVNSALNITSLYAGEERSC